MRPIDVLQRHIDLIEDIESRTLTSLMVHLGIYANGYSKDECHDVVNITRQHVRRADTYLIVPSMIQQIMDCAENEIDGNIPFGKQAAPPTPFGFMYFPDPIRHMERRSHMQFIHTIVWGATIDADGKHGFTLALFNDVRREPDEIMLAGLADSEFNEIVSSAGGWSPVGITVVGCEAKIGPYRIFCTPAEQKKVREDGDVPTAYTINIAYVILAAWKLMSETIDYGETTIERPERATARRATRIGISPEVTVVNLRRLRHKIKNPGTGQPLEWRQEVAGHWKLQAYGPGRKLRRKIWVDKYEQGPEDAPHRPSKGKVTRLTR